MNRYSRVTAAMLLLGGLAAAGLAAAQEGPTDGPMGGPMPEQMRRMGGPMGHAHGGIDFAALDADGNGQLARAELLARATERLAAADANGDGALDRDEIIVVMPGPRLTFVHVFGADPAEAQADQLLALMGATETGRVEVAALAERRTNDLIAWIDTDRDGVVSAEEADAMQDRWERHAGRGRHGGEEHDRR